MHSWISFFIIFPSVTDQHSLFCYNAYLVTQFFIPPFGRAFLLCVIFESLRPYQHSNFETCSPHTTSFVLLTRSRPTRCLIQLASCTFKLPFIVFSLYHILPSLCASLQKLPQETIKKLWAPLFLLTNSASVTRLGYNPMLLSVIADSWYWLTYLSRPTICSTFSVFLSAASDLSWQFHLALRYTNSCLRWSLQALQIWGRNKSATLSACALVCCLPQHFFQAASPNHFFVFFLLSWASFIIILSCSTNFSHSTFGFPLRTMLITFSRFRLLLRSTTGSAHQFLFSSTPSCSLSC